MKNTERIARLIQWMMLANWNALLTEGIQEKQLVISTASKCVLLLVPTVECLSFTVQNDVCAEFNVRRLFSD